MRPALLRTLALVSVAVFILGLALDISEYLTNPCPGRFFFQSYLVLIGGLEILPALVGSIAAAGLAAVQRQWGWVAGLLVAAVFGVVFLYGAVLDQPLAAVSAVTTTLSGGFDHGLGLTTCGSQSSQYIQAIAVTLPLLAAPIVLFCYSFSRALSQARVVPVQRQ
jgi:hypothetical protein